MSTAPEKIDALFVRARSCAARLNISVISNRYSHSHDLADYHKAMGALEVALGLPEKNRMTLSEMESKYRLEGAK